MRHLLSAFLLCAPLAAQAPLGRTSVRTPVNGITAEGNAVTPAPVRPEDKCSLEGTVVNAVTGEPLKKAHLLLRPFGQQNGVPYGTLTDAAGHFLIDGVDPNRYNFSASRNGFVTQIYSPQGGPNRMVVLALSNGQTMKDIVFKLTPQGVIAGRILDEDGDPLSNVAVQCMVYGYQRGRRQLMNRNGSSTNDLGEFRLYGLSPGKYVLSATYQSREMFTMTAERTVGTAQAIQAAEEGYATTYYPSSTNPDGATVLEITPGAQITGLSMTLARTRTVRIRGHVSAGFAIETQRNINVMLTPRDNSGFGMPRGIARGIDAQGNFEMRGIAPGSYILRANYAEDNKQYAARLPIEVGNSNVEGVELELQPPAEIEGRIAVENNGDLKGAQMSISLQPRTPAPMMGGGFAQAKNDQTFKIVNVSPDSFDFNIFGLPEGFFVNSIHLGQQDVTESGLDFSSGVSHEQITVTVNPNGGQIDGSVQNAKGDAAVAATVTLIPDAEHRSIGWLYKTANTDQNGHFTMKGIRPGDYKIYAWEEIEPGASQDPDFVKPHESSGESVSIKESAHENVQLKLIPAENTANSQPSR